MSDFHTATRVPLWRLLLYGCIAQAAACWIGYHFGNHDLIIVAAIGIPLVIVSVLTLFRFGRSPAAQRHRGVILWVYLLSQAALIVWSIVERTITHDA